MVHETLVGGDDDGRRRGRRRRDERRVFAFQDRFDLRVASGGGHVQRGFAEVAPTCQHQRGGIRCEHRLYHDHGAAHHGGVKRGLPGFVLFRHVRALR